MTPGGSGSGSSAACFEQRLANDRRRRFGPAAAFDRPGDERSRHWLLLDGVDDANRQDAVGDRHGDFSAADRHVEAPHVQRVSEVRSDVGRTWWKTRECDTAVGAGRTAAPRHGQRGCDQGRHSASHQDRRRRGRRVVRLGGDHDSLCRASRRRNTKRRCARNDDAGVDGACRWHRDGSREREILSHAARPRRQRRCPHTIASSREPLEGHPPLGARPQDREAQRGQRQQVFEQHDLVRHRHSGPIEQVDVKRGARLNDDRAAIDDWFRAGDGDIRDACLRVTYRVESQRRRAVRQRTDPYRSVGVGLDRGCVRRLEERTAAPVERKAPDDRRGDGLTNRRDKSYAEIGRRLEMDRRQAQRSRGR